MTLGTPARLTISEKVRTNKLPAIVPVLVRMALRSEKPQNRSISVAHLLVPSALKGYANTTYQLDMHAQNANMT